MKTTLPHRQALWDTAIFSYWLFALFAGTYFWGGHLLWGSSQAATGSSSIFFIAALLGFLFHRLRRDSSTQVKIVLVVLHLWLGQAVLAWQFVHLPLRDYTLTGDPGIKQDLTFLISSLNVFLASAYGGILGAVGSLGVHYSFIFSSDNGFNIQWIYPLLMSLFGMAANYVIWRMYQMHLELEQIAVRDPLTGLYNRVKLEEVFERYHHLSQQYQQPLLLMVWDLDNLKQVNDEKGHSAGDQYIRRFANTLQKQIRRPSSLRHGDTAFRVGGDEFVTLHLGLTSGEGLQERLELDFPWASVGWALVQDSDIDLALSAADQEMYLQKQLRKQTLKLPEFEPLEV